MKAVVCKELGAPSLLVVEDIPSPPVGRKQVKVLVKACSVNFPDTLTIQGKYQFTPPMPFTPGSDISGIIVAVGDAVKHLKVGDAVLGTAMIGGFAEEVVMDASMCFPKPPNMSFPIAASFMMAYATSYHALKDRANLKEGETLLVLGASGGVGLAAVEIGKAFGAKVIAAASTDEKLALCKKHGADALINYSTEDLKKQAKSLAPNGVDVVYDPVGGDYSEAALRAMAWNGRFLVVGFPAGIPKIPLNLPLLKSCQIVGVFWGRFAMEFPKDNYSNTMELVQLLSEGKVNPYIDKEYKLEETPQALQDMMDRKVKGKIVITP